MNSSVRNCTMEEDIVKQLKDMHKKGNFFETYSILVDLDNTLVFSDEANNQAYRKAFEDNGVYLTDEQYQMIFSEFNINRIDQSFICVILSKFADHSVDFQKIIKRKRDIFYGFLGYIKPNKKLIKTLFEIRKLERYTNIFLMTSSHPKRVNDILTFFQLEDLIDHTIFCIRRDDNKIQQAIEFYCDPNEVLVIDDQVVQLEVAKLLGVPSNRTFLISEDIAFNITTNEYRKI